MSSHAKDNYWNKKYYPQKEYRKSYYKNIIVSTCIAIDIPRLPIFQELIIPQTASTNIYWGQGER